MPTIYTKKEKQEIIKTLDVILDDLEEIWDLGLLESIEVPVKLEGIDTFDPKYPNNGWYFAMDKIGVHMKNSLEKDIGFIFARRLVTGKLNRLYNVDDREIMFFKEYDHIRNAIMEEITRIQEKKKSDMTIVSQVKNKYDRNAFIQISLPPTNNQQPLKVRKEDGRTVGTLDFGPFSINLITDGSIKLVQEEAKPKTKSK